MPDILTFIDGQAAGSECPDFATFIVRYLPDQRMVGLKSLKLYLNSFRNEYISHEEITDKIYSELEKKPKPSFLEVVWDFNPRGNLKTVIRASSEQNRK